METQVDQNSSVLPAEPMPIFHAKRAVLNSALYDKACKMVH
jgi:hypothetical protein